MCYLYSLRPICVALLRRPQRFSPRACRKYSRTLTLLTLKRSGSYLLGSGGTLMFDVAIVTQSFIYRPHPRLSGSRTFSREVTAPEEEGLMRADASDVEEPYPPRRRLPVTAEETDVMD